MLTVLPWYGACLESTDWLAVRLFSSLPASSWQQRQHAVRQPVSERDGAVGQLLSTPYSGPWHTPMLSAFPTCIPIAFNRQPQFLVQPHESTDTSSNHPTQPCSNWRRGRRKRTSVPCSSKLAEHKSETPFRCQMVALASRCHAAAYLLQVVCLGALSGESSARASTIPSCS